MEEDGDKRLYFILETKGITFEFDLRTPERLKFNCGRAHFKTVAPDVQMKLAKKWS